MEGIRAPGEIAPGAFPANEGPHDLVDIIAMLPRQGFAPHVELDENGRVVFAPAAALDAEGNNLPRLRNLLPELIATADALRDLLTRGNQAHAALVRRLAAYRAQLHPDLADVTLARVLAEGIRLENAAAAARTQMAAGELPTHDEDAEEALESLLSFNRMFVMATADGPAMLADEARYRRTPAEEAALRSTLLQFAATASEDPAAVAPDVAEMLAATVCQSGDTQEATRARRLGEGLTGNILITATYAATLAVIAASVATAAGLAPAGLVTWAGYKTIEKTKAYAATIEAGAKVLDKARDLDAAAAAEYLRTRLSHISNLMTRAKPSLTTLSRQDERFAWLSKPLQWFNHIGEVGTAELALLPEGFSEAAVRRKILADEPVPAVWASLVRNIDLHASPIYSISSLTGFIHLEFLNISNTNVTGLKYLAHLTSIRTLNISGCRVSSLAPLSKLTDLEVLDFSDTWIRDVSPISDLTKLKFLNLGGPELSLLDPLARLHNLQSLNLQGTSVVDLAPLAGLPNLQYLNLGGTNVTNLVPLAGLAKLQSLVLWGTKVTSLAPLAGLGSLRQLDLTGLPNGIESALRRLAEIKIFR